jgi:hypothetical protein
MIEKCSIGNMSYNIQNITLIILILILIIVIIYYLRNSSTKHNELIEKYTTPTDIKSDESYNTHNAIANSLINSEFPTSGTEVTLRACQVQFNNKFDDNPNDTVRYVYQDDWQEIATLKEPGVNSTFNDVPIKIISRSNETNQDAITNYSERSKCFRKMSATDNKYRYQGNDLIQYRTGNNLTKGTHSQLNADGALENYMEMKFNLDPLKTSDYYNNLKTSICSLKYSNTLGGTSLGDKVLYRLTLNARYQITAINQITINSTNNHIFTVNLTTDLAALLTSSDRTISYVYNGTNFVYKDKLNNTGTQDNGKNNIDVEIYTFNRELLCNRENEEKVKYQTIKSYKIIDNNKIDVNTILKATSGDVEAIIENTNFPGTATDKSYTSKDSLLTAIETRIKSEKDTANASVNTDIERYNRDITTTEGERNIFLTSINTKATFFDKIFDADTVEIRKTFLVSESGLISGLELNKLGYTTEDVSAYETILKANQEPSFSIIKNNNEYDIYNIDVIEDTSRVHSKYYSNKTGDILVIGGGGGGGKRHGSGGGAGTLLYHKNVILNGTYNIKVGKGGAGFGSTSTQNVPTSDRKAFDGEYSQFIKSDGTQNYYAVGGGRGATGGDSYANTNGGQGYMYDAKITLSSGNIFNGAEVKVLNKQYVNTLPSPEGCRGNIGGTELINYNGGGGGGAGGAGMNHAEETTVNDGYGGLGLAIDITGTSVVYAGGGNGAGWSGSLSQVFNPSYPTIQSRGGGGFGSDTGAAQNGLDGTGGGGGGQGNDNNGNPAGNGGSGIVIIKYKNVPEQDGNEKKITLTCDTNQFNRLVYDFSPYNDMDSWKTYAKNNGFNYQFTHWNNNRIWEYSSVGGSHARHITSRGFIELKLNNDYDYVIIEFSIPDAGNIGINNDTAYVNLFMYDNGYHKETEWNDDYNSKNSTQLKGTWWHRDYKDQPLKYETSYTKDQSIRIVEYESAISKNIKITLLKRVVTYSVFLPINTSFSINNGNTETLNAGTYNIIMTPVKSRIINSTNGTQIGSEYNNIGGNKLTFKYKISRTLSQLHELSTTFSGTQYKNSIADEKYSLGTKEINKITKYRIYLYRKQGVNHDIQLYAGGKELTNGTDYTTSGSYQEADVPTITLYNFYITINKTISGAIYLKSINNNPIFYIDETSRTTFNNTTDTQFSTNVNNLTDSASTKLPILNSMFGVTEATRDLATARNNLITYDIGANAKLTIDFKSNPVSPVSRTSLNNLAIAYNTISGYSPQGSGGITPKLNANFGDILNSAPTDIDEYISYEFPSPPTDAQITPANRANRFNIKSQATKYVYFKKKGGGANSN